MNSDVIDEVLNAWPPDFRLEGADVEKMIRDMPTRRHVPRERPERAPDAEQTSRRSSPKRAVPAFDERMIDLIYHAVNHLREVFRIYRREWPLACYTVLLSWYTEHGLANVAFCPKSETLIQGIPFEVSDRGMYANGPGVNFIISLADYSLIKTVYMR